MENTSNSVKKRLMFVKGEDFYFLTYNIILILIYFGCNGKPRKFKDYRKLGILIELISHRDIITILHKYQGSKIQNMQDRQKVARVYSSALIKTKLLPRLLFALEKKGIVELEKDSTRKTISLWFTDKVQNENFYSESLFKSEQQNLESLSTVVKRVSSIKYDTFVKTLFKSSGITKWDI